MKAVIDTNALITIISKRSHLRWIFDDIIKGKIRICFSTDILFEYHEILQLKTNPVIAERILKALLNSPYIEKTEVYFSFDLISQDKSDNKFVDCAISAGAVIISNDAHFKILKSVDFPKVSVFTLEEFDHEFKGKVNK